MVPEGVLEEMPDEMLEKVPEEVLEEIPSSSGGESHARALSSMLFSLI